MSRESFLATVRQAARAGQAYRVHLRDDIPPNAGYIGAGDDAVVRMASEVVAVGGQAHVVSDFAAARQALAIILQAHACRAALCWQHAVLDALGLSEFLAEHGVERLDHERLAALPEADRRLRMLSADIGITSATWAVAETGTLVMASAAGSERLASLLPPLHVAVITAEQILPDLFDLFDRLQAADPQDIAANVTLITGPSKTGDIELKLTTGVHGPGEWHVIVVRE